MWHRDAGRCRTPGCRSSRGLEIHHIVHRANGGSHEPANLILLCSACHHAHHDGLLAITGIATKLDVRRTNDVRPHVGRATKTTPPMDAEAATAALERAIREALRPCLRPMSARTS